MLGYDHRARGSLNSRRFALLTAAALLSRDPSARPTAADVLAHPDPTTFQILPWRGEVDPTARMFCDITTPDGQPADPSTVKQNTRLVAVLSVMKQQGEADSGQFLLVDRLPAGFEIENPTLVATGGTADLPWLTDTSYASYTEFRDDRFVAAMDLPGRGPFAFAYVARAVTPGDFLLPGAEARDMYRPTVTARTAARRVGIAPGS